jgi:calcineurin-like phosphoesterase family protein/2'-5' RNA ligase
MAKYLIEIRLYGYAKRYARNIIWDVAKKFRVKGATRRRPVPHVTLAGEFTSSHIREIIREVESVGRKYNPIPFQIKGIDSFTSKKGQKVIGFHINPSKQLENLRWELAQRIKPYAELKEYDKKKDFIFHATIAFKDIDRKFSKIYRYLQEQEGFEINTHMLRICILRSSNRKILCEYDMHLQQFLNRRQAKDKKRFRRELKELREKPIKFSLDKMNPNRIFLTSDLHLNHDNIIDLANRPFTSGREMNKVLIHNWNKTIKKDDIVFYLGDLAFGRNKNKIPYWLKKLNGRVLFIGGNHDKGYLKSVLHFHTCIITYKGKEFLLIHDPKKVMNWNGWIIHGHEHNKHLSTYPFINRYNKTINISTDLTGFKPISLNSIINRVENMS